MRGGLNVRTINSRGLKARLQGKDQLASKAPILGICKTRLRKHDTDVAQAVDTSTGTPPLTKTHRVPGGVTFIIQPLLPKETIHSNSSHSIKSLSLRIYSMTIKTVSISPRAGWIEVTEALQEIEKISNHRAIILGDMSVRLKLCDKANNVSGFRQHCWASSKDWAIKGPRTHFYITRRGINSPDNFLTKGLSSRDVKTMTEKPLRRSHHLPVQLTISAQCDGSTDERDRNEAIPRRQRNPQIPAQGEPITSPSTQPLSRR